MENVDLLGAVCCYGAVNGLNAAALKKWAAHGGWPSGTAKCPLFERVASGFITQHRREFWAF